MRFKLDPTKDNVYDVYLVGRGHSFFSKRYLSRKTADTASRILLAKYKHLGFATRVDTILPTEGGQATGDPSANRNPPR